MCVGLDCFALLAMTEEKDNFAAGVVRGLDCFAMLAMTEGDAVSLQRDMKKLLKKVV